MASTSYNQTPSSSTPTPTSPSTLWDVFLSFRGNDTRNTFTSHLYKDLLRAGIRTFKDDPELLGGEVISRALPQAIQESKTYIVVLSENYASSPWCLDELEVILDCFEQMERLVIPVFYYIDPYVVRHQLESFKVAFEKHLSRFDSEKVNRWRLTLNEIAGFSGYHISQNSSQADIVDQVVDRVLLAINPTTLDVAKYPVGLDSSVEAISMLLKDHTEGVIRIGIYGMGGVGKTTLAKAVYNKHHKQFQGSCFLSNVREVSRTEQGQVCLQKQLLTDVLKFKEIDISNVDHGIELIRARLCSRKVLIALDDLDDQKLLEVLEGPFASGSITIITTRNEDMLDSIKVQAKYKVNEMDDDQSRQLFAQHAFGDYKIPDKFTKLSQDILKRAGGLPLALKVFGSSMFNKREEEWRWFINKLNRVPLDDIDKKLLISFKALETIDPVLQNIFLDIACFYIGQNKKRVITIMETCYNTYVHLNIDILQKRCLITIDELGILGMHDLLRDMGREITRNNSPDEPEKHSRLWVPEDIDYVLKNHKGTEAIQGIISGFSKFEYEDEEDEEDEEVEEVTFAAESFKKMSKLRFLCLNNVNLTGSFEQTFKDLRWLRWVGCPLKCLPSEFHPQKLVILELPHSKIRIWELNMVFEKLKTLDMRKSENLTTTPDFTRLPCLETFNLSYCRSLKEVHISIRSLVRLVSLNLKGCTNLRSLPGSICSLRALEFLDISECKKLEELPDQLGNIKSLKVLKARSTSVSKLPDSIGRLSKLVVLNFRWNMNLKTLPDGICNLRSLEVLDISFCEKLEELPDQLGKITSLRKIDASGGLTHLKMIPDISRLSNLEDLNLHGCYSLVSIAELPPNLKKLDAGYCWSLERLPNLSNLKHLEELDLIDCTNLRSLPDSICSLRALEFLDISECKKLEELPDQLGNIKSLEVLKARSTSVSKLPDSIGRLSNLVELNLWDCWNLETLPASICNLRSLEVLDISYCKKLEELPDQLGKITSLRKIDASGGLTHLKMIPDISRLSNLEDLNLGDCLSLVSIAELPPNLKKLDAGYCCSLKRFPNLSHLKHLEELDLLNCTNLTEIEGFVELICLKRLEIDGCSSLEGILDVSNLKLLERLNLTDCTGFTEIHGFEELTSLRKLFLKGCNSSPVASILTKSCLEMCCGFQHEVEIYIESETMPNWVSESSKVRGSRVSLDLQPNESHDILGIIFCFSEPNSFGARYWVKNMASGLTWSRDYPCGFPDNGPVIVIVPSSILPIRDDDHNNIEIGFHREISYGIHLLYKTKQRLQQ